jgi:predicted DNA-binding transcriptional regulator AlpA
MQSTEELLNTPIKGRLLRAKEVAFRLGISIPTLYHWEKTEGFPTRIRLGPNSVAWKGDEVQQWLDNLELQNDF